MPDDQTCAKVKADFGMTDDDLRTEVPAFHALNVQNGVLSKDWTATFYLFCKRWKEHRDKQPAPRLELSKAPSTPFAPTDADWEKAAAFYAKTGRWMRDHGPDPMSPACRCPKDIHESQPPPPDEVILVLDQLYILGVAAD